jgi:hypothetical protein
MLAVFAVASTAVVLATPSSSATLSATKLTPRGHYVRASVVPGTALKVTIGSITSSCTSVTSSPTSPLGTNSRNRIPVSGNPTVSGPVRVTINRPTISHCTSSLGAAETMTASTSGTWYAYVQYSSSGSTAKLRVPAGGIVVHASGLANCTTTVAPSAAAYVGGHWTNGSPSTVTVSKAQIAVHTTGPGFCPTSTTVATITGKLRFTDATSPTSQVRVYA